jgi:DNA-binding CsgD family transcriptional regulator
MARDEFDDLAWPSVAAALGLSPRELEITRCLVSDVVESAIGERLGLSRHAAYDHLQRVYRKVGVNSRLELIVKVFSIHLLVAARAVDERAGLLGAEAHETGEPIAVVARKRLA